jgi:hypothetical protein
MSSDEIIKWVQGQLHKAAEEADKDDWEEAMLTLKVALATLGALTGSEPTPQPPAPPTESPKPTGHPKSHPFPKAERFGKHNRTLAQLRGGVPACILVTQHLGYWDSKCTKDGWTSTGDDFDMAWKVIRHHRDTAHPLGGKKEGA